MSGGSHALTVWVGEPIAGHLHHHPAQAHGASKSNLLGLIQALGRETAGAIRQRAELPFSVWDQTVRLSIAGYQDKIAVHERDGSLFLVDGGPMASTVIVKPVPIRAALAVLPGNNPRSIFEIGGTAWEAS